MSVYSSKHPSYFNRYVQHALLNLPLDPSVAHMIVNLYLCAGLVFLKVSSIAVISVIVFELSHDQGSWKNR